MLRWLYRVLRGYELWQYRRWSRRWRKLRGKTAGRFGLLAPEGYEERRARKASATYLKRAARLGPLTLEELDSRAMDLRAREELMRGMTGPGTKAPHLRSKSTDERR